jgi:lipopolysaccharide transport system ATP-binding protein
LDPEILLVDEVLAVGDAAFQRKCLNKMEDVSHGGRTVIFVSHNMASIESLCRTGLLIVDGVVAARGAARDVVRTYLDWAGSPNRVDLANRTDRRGDGRLRFVDVETELRAGAPGSIRLAYRADGDLTNVEVSVGLFTPRGEGAAYLSNSLTGDEFAVLPRQGALTCDIPRSGILPGKYSMNIYCTSNGMLLDWIVGAMDVEVAEGDFFGTGKVPPPSYGSVAIDHRWSIEA